MALPETTLSRIHLKDLAVRRGATLFANLNRTIGPGDQLGLVAANGRGKSTLLRCLAGEDAPATGEITRSRGLRVGHMAQEVPLELADTPVCEVVRQALPTERADSESWRATVELLWFSCRNRRI